MKQQTLEMTADQGAGFEQHRRPIQREEFLDTMNRIVPWTDLCAVIEPHYPKRGNGRPPIGEHAQVGGVSSTIRTVARSFTEGVTGYSGKTFLGGRVYSGIIRIV